MRGSFECSEAKRTIRSSAAAASQTALLIRWPRVRALSPASFPRRRFDWPAAFVWTFGVVPAARPLRDYASSSATRRGCFTAKGNVEHHAIAATHELGVFWTPQGAADERGLRRFAARRARPRPRAAPTCRRARTAPKLFRAPPRRRPRRGRGRGRSRLVRGSLRRLRDLLGLEQDQDLCVEPRTPLHAVDAGDLLRPMMFTPSPRHVSRPLWGWKAPRETREADLERRAFSGLLGAVDADLDGLAERRADLQVHPRQRGRLERRRGVAEERGQPVQRDCFRDCSSSCGVDFCVDYCFDFSSGEGCHLFALALCLLRCVMR